MAYAQGRRPDGETYALRDPREAEITRALASADGSAEAIAAAFSELPGFVPDALRHNPAWFRLVVRALEKFLANGPRAAVKAELI